MANILDAVHRNRCRSRGGNDVCRSFRKNYGHGRDAAVFSGAAVCGVCVSGFYIFGYSAADSERAEQSYCGGAAFCAQKGGRYTGRSVRRYAHALDMHTVCYIPAERDVHAVFHIRPCAGMHGLRGVCIHAAGKLHRGHGEVQKHRPRQNAAGGIFFPHGIHEADGIRSGGRFGRGHI